MLGTLLAAAGCAQLLASPGPVAEAPRPPRVLEASLRVGPTFTLGNGLPGATSDRIVGMGLALSVFYRSRYFLAPFVEGGHTRLSTGSAFVPRGAPGGPGTLSDRLTAWHVVGGLSYSAWRLRAGLGAGLYAFGLTSKLDGISSSTQALSVGFAAHVGVRLLEASRFFTALDLVSHNAPTTNLHYLQVALSIHGDLFTAR
jgi:hypothetical protein